MGEAWVITSGKGGAGKSTFTANLGTALAELGKKCILIDADTGLRSLDVLLGMENRVVYDLCDIAEGTCRLKQAIVTDRERPNISMIAAAQTREAGSVTPVQMAKLVDQLKAIYDFVLIDSPAGIGRGFRSAIAAADHAAIVMLPEVLSVRDAERVKGLLHLEGLDEPRLVINRAEKRHFKEDSPMNIRALERRLDLKLLGVVPEDELVSASEMAGRPVALGNGQASLAFGRIAKRFMGQEVALPAMKKIGLWGRLLGKKPIDID